MSKSGLQTDHTLNLDHSNFGAKGSHDMANTGNGSCLSQSVDIKENICLDRELGISRSIGNFLP